MRKYHDLSLTYQSIKSARRPKQEPILIEDSYSTNRPTVSGQRFTYDRDHFKNELKTPHSHRIVQFQQKQPEKYLQYNETSKSLIVSPEKEDICERNNSKEKHSPNLLQRSSRKMEVPNPKPKNEPFKKLKNPELLIKEDKYLQMAKKEKQKNHPTFTLMFNPKSPRKAPKTQRNIFEELRQTEDTIPENFQQKKPSYLKPSDFHQVRLLGKGKNGQVYLAIHKKTGFACAMKIIKKKDINRGSFIERQKLYTQLLRQIKIQMFMSHSNLVELYCVFSDKQNIYLIQQLGINGQLYELMRKKNKLSQQSTALISREILQGLKAMHQKHIIHRDLKPQNIVLIYGIAKICDFGSSVHCSSQMRSTLCGTPLYLSPQILVGEEYNQKIDIWAYGTLVYELFTGQNPFRVKHKFQLIKIVTDQLIFEDNFPKKLKHFLLFILKKNSLERPKAEQIQKHQFLKKYVQLQTSQELSNL